MSEPSRKRAIVVGCLGQDGRLLESALRARGDIVTGIDRGFLASDLPLRAGGTRAVDIRSREDVDIIVRAVAPDEVYFLAAHHRSSEPDAKDEILFDARSSLAVNVIAPLRFAEALRRFVPTARLFYASSSAIFGPRCNGLQNESTPIAPVGNYALTKALAGENLRAYRDRHGLYCSIGILFNHESPYRGPSFVSQKIVEGLLEIRSGHRRQLELENTDAVVDWGDARDFVDAFMRILTLERPDDFVVATGVARTVRDFVRVAADRIGVDWRTCCATPAANGRAAGGHSGRIGDAAKLRLATGWRPTNSFEAMIDDLVTAAESRHATRENG